MSEEKVFLSKIWDIAKKCYDTHILDEKFVSEIWDIARTFEHFIEQNDKLKAENKELKQELIENLELQLSVPLYYDMEETLIRGRVSELKEQLEELKK